jgi:hypothetical protein
MHQPGDWLNPAFGQQRNDKTQWNRQDERDEK